MAVENLRCCKQGWCSKFDKDYEVKEKLYGTVFSDKGVEDQTLKIQVKHNYCPFCGEKVSVENKPIFPEIPPEALTDRVCSYCKTNIFFMVLSESGGGKALRCGKCGHIEPYNREKQSMEKAECCVCGQKPTIDSYSGSDFGYNLFCKKCSLVGSIEISLEAAIRAWNNKMKLKKEIENDTK